MIDNRGVEIEMRGFACCSKLGTNVFVCEQCGWAHLCGEGCTERFMDLSSELPVCPISGRCFTRMMTWAEVCTAADLHHADHMCLLCPLHKHSLAVKHFSWEGWQKPGKECALLTALVIAMPGGEGNGCPRHQRRGRRL